MKPRFFVRLSLLAAAALLAAGSAVSQVSAALEVRVGPPAPRYEYVGPAPFHHAVWARGHWAWDPRDGRYEWVRGHWIAARPAYVWYDGGWYRGPRGWAWREGYWQHRGNGHKVFERRDRADRYADSDWRGDDGRGGHRDDRRYERQERGRYDR